MLNTGAGFHSNVDETYELYYSDMEHFEESPFYQGPGYYAPARVGGCIMVLCVLPDDEQLGGIDRKEHARKKAGFTGGMGKIFRVN